MHTLRRLVLHRSRPPFHPVVLLVGAILLLAACASSERAQAQQAESSSQEKIWDPNAVRLQAQELAPGVYAVVPSDAATKNPAGIPVATSGGFVVGEHAVLVIDTMINERLAQQLIALVRGVTDRPIRYVVNTSYHGDHSYGNMYFPASTVVIQHAATAEYIANHFEDDVAFMVQYFGTDSGLEAIAPRPADLLLGDGDEMTVDLGGRRVEIRQFGFAQTDGDLFVWVPEAEVMWTGNPLIAEAPAIPWLLDGKHAESLATMRRVRAFLPEGAMLVPGHGRPVDVEAIDAHIAYLDALDREVRRAVAAGLTLDETVERVHLPRFADYAIYGWVHAQLNVPQAYQALQAEADAR